MGAGPGSGSSDESRSSGRSCSRGKDKGKGKGGSIQHQLLTSLACPSTNDSVTMATLPKNKPHVCYVSPNGKTRHCFALDTLYRIAISAREGAANDESRVALGGAPAPLVFLQPSHFRASMDDDLLDQIALRFGRPELVIEDSELYRKTVGRHDGLFGAMSVLMDKELDQFDKDGEYVGHGSASCVGVSTQRNFRNCFERYMQELMGSTDVYCCPLCYNEADRRQGSNEDEEMWEDDESKDEKDDGTALGTEDRFSFLDDPLTILGSLDLDKFEVAATFCFRLLSDLKKHLRDVHGVDPREVEGNDVFKRFQIRASDGLLQSWLRRSTCRTTVQGDMARYWRGGENQSFVLLLNQIEKRKLHEEQDDDEEEREGGFCGSYPRRARRVWMDVSAPYLKQADMGDFIAEEGADEDERSATVRINPHFNPPNRKGEELVSPEEQIMEHLRRKNLQRGNVYSSDGSSAAANSGSASSDNSDGELEVLPKPPQFEEEEEEDEWTRSKRLKMAKTKARSKRTSSKAGSSDDDNDVFASDLENPKPQFQTKATPQKRIIEDDGNDSNSGSDRPGSKAAETNHGSARKRVAESSSSEEESG